MKFSLQGNCAAQIFHLKLNGCVSDEDDGDYFEIGSDGEVRLKKGKKKIDISKLNEEQLRQLGIDPKTMSKEEIARILKVFAVS